MEHFIAILLFALVTTGTPGPNNIMIMTSGLNFGLRRSVPHLCGICLGFPAMVAAVGFGLGSLFQRYPDIHLILKLTGIGYLLFLAYKIAHAHSHGTANNAARPFTFLQAAGFQWVNPKAWIMAIGATATYTQIGGDMLLQVSLIVLAFALVAFPCVGSWLYFGSALKRLLKQSRHVILFNRVMALLLVASIVPMLDLT